MSGRPLEPYLSCRCCSAVQPRRAFSSSNVLQASDESNATTGKRLDSVGIENTETNRRDWRELLYTAPGGFGLSGSPVIDDNSAVPGCFLAAPSPPLQGATERDNAPLQSARAILRRCQAATSLGSHSVPPANTQRMAYDMRPLPCLRASLARSQCEAVKRRAALACSPLMRLCWAMLGSGLRSRLMVMRASASASCLRRWCGSARPKGNMELHHSKCTPQRVAGRLRRQRLHHISRQ